MQKATLIGVVGGLVAILTGMVIKGAPLAVLLNPAAFLIIIAGTGAALFNAFTLEKMKKFPALLKILFKQQKLMTQLDLLKFFVKSSKTARSEGLLALEGLVDEIEDPFLKNGLMMVIDGMDADFVRTVLETDISAMEERHRDGALIFSQGGMYAPTLGVLGAVVGLIAALGNLSDVDKLGHAIAAAFVATLLGIFVGYVLCHPFSTKLKVLSKEETEIKNMMVEGSLSLLTGESPASIEVKLVSFLSAKDKQVWEQTKETTQQTPTED
ncbi:MAG: flagellar motor stator protein MotA [Peptococcaceae bacterium]|nr:flagellar motor stator protein MotA [Peptococcaceae bacterium]